MIINMDKGPINEIAQRGCPIKDIEIPSHIRHSKK